MLTNIDNLIDKKDIVSKFKKLFKIPRSILGNGFRDSLDLIGEDLNLKKVVLKSKTKVLDWIIPDEWNIDDGYLITPENRKICDFKKNNLHILNYSLPVNKLLDLKTLKKKIFTLPNYPSAIPYVTSYYKRDWGFSLDYNTYSKLKKGKYQAIIKSKIKPGKLVYSDNVIKGKSKKEVLIYSYLCHPQMANHELSGPLVWRELFKILKRTGPHNLSYRFVMAPENIGAAAFLSKNKKNINKKIISGYILNCLGYGKNYTLKKSRKFNSLSDRAALNALMYKKTEIREFFPDGSDERQFCSPGFNLPISLVMRKMFGEFREYHTSKDDENFISFPILTESIKTYYEILMTIDSNFTPIGKILFGTPQLSKSNFDLYPKQMNFKIKEKSKEVKLTLDILNKADGSQDLIQIFEKNNTRLIDHLDLIQKLLKSGYIKKK